MQTILEILQDTAIDTIKLIPFLFVTYLIMEYIEHKTSNKIQKTIKKSGKFGPLLGAVVGIFPQCGFSVSATNLYAGKVITLGTLIAVYLTTSDEMLPILLTESVPINTILTILGIKLVLGIVAGFLVDFIFKIIKKGKNEEEQQIEELCEHEHCHCDEGIVPSALKHTINITIFIFIITLILNSIITCIGEETIAHFISKNVILGPVIAGLIGLIPNCASSVIITELFIEKVISMPILISGVAVNAGVGLLVLFKTNKNIKENMSIVGLLYLIGVLAGIILELFL